MVNIFPTTADDKPIKDKKDWLSASDINMNYQSPLNIIALFQEIQAGQHKEHHLEPHYVQERSQGRTTLLCFNPMFVDRLIKTFNFTPRHKPRDYGPGMIVR